MALTFEEGVRLMQDWQKGERGARVRSSAGCAAANSYHYVECPDCGRRGSVHVGVEIPLVDDDGDELDDTDGLPYWKFESTWLDRSNILQKPKSGVDVIEKRLNEIVSLRSDYIGHAERLAKVEDVLQAALAQLKEDADGR